MGPDATRGRERPESPGGDYHLRWLVALVNVEPSVKPRISLSVGGVIYSGTLISRREYAHRMRAEVDRMDLPPHLDELWREPFGTMVRSEDDAASDQTRRLDLTDEIDRASHVHLADFTAWQADWPSFTDGQPPWRGQIEKVDGWTLADIKPPRLGEENPRG
ncbi:hypothetical protein [Nocardioides sp. CFH 31398]|uniref:hypothetical protein n=1 Tax=Nocardioides sp. CFH 31398 TaxID=2919579 RepID=UPI001F05BD2A|nr:hypothetical protein [Nocardioides sp. CFH 31398]MCH1865202.1 hypothetical protein [Nocardioides sp. CFH 31398]